MQIVVMEPLGVSRALIDALAEPFIRAGHAFTYYEQRALTQEELRGRIKSAEILVLANQPLDAEQINACGRLKFLDIAFTGVDHVDMAALRARGITVANAAGYSTRAVTELVFALTLALLRRIVPCDGRARSGGTKDGLIGTELGGKTFGVVGTGAIGSAVARLALAFGCRVLAFSRSEKADLKAAGVAYTTLEDLLARADIVSLHTPLNAATKHLLNRERLALMRPSAILINTARGGVVDNAALADALKAGAIAAAGLDVFDSEPPLDAAEPLLAAANTLLTPHVAFASEEALAARAAIVFKNIEQFLAGTPVNLVK